MCIVIFMFFMLYCMYIHIYIYLDRLKIYPPTGPGNSSDHDLRNPSL